MHRSPREIWRYRCPGRLAAIVGGQFVNDGYHIAPLTCCTGDLVVGWGIAAVERDFPNDPDLQLPIVEAAYGSF